MLRLAVRWLTIGLALGAWALLSWREQHDARRAVDQIVAEAVSGYLKTTVPTGATGDYRADRLIASVNRLAGSAYWSAGIQVEARGVLVIDGVSPPSGAAWALLPARSAAEAIGTVWVWAVAGSPLLPPLSIGLLLAALLISALAATRRLRWVWPALGSLVLIPAGLVVVREVDRVAADGAGAALRHVAPLAALALLDGRVEIESLKEWSESLSFRALDEGGDLGIGEVRIIPHGETLRAVMGFERGGRKSGWIEVSLGVPKIDHTRLGIGLLGGGLVLLLAMGPPVSRGNRRPRLNKPSR